jgi:predicted nuclease with TOPRIM domain
MSKMLSKMNLISVVQQMPKEDIETIQGYVEMIEEENQELKKQLHDASIQIQELIEKDIWCPSNCEKLEKLQQENKQLKDNWNELKEYISKTKLNEFEKSYGKRYGKTFTQAEIIACNMILNKMQELQGSDSNE